MCKGGCAYCRRAAREAGLRRAAFRCSTCKRTVGWCQGGDESPADPKGTRCSECFCKASKKLEAA